ncbi:MAG: hypothetical protein OXE17_07600 [Chloroflexi bacterium]|nr:hypothetical protein [Chloroflexota bacterium]
MNLLSTNKLGAISLIVGPTLAFVMFLIQPGGILLDTAPLSDPAGLMEAWQGNPAMVKITSGLIMLGLALMAFGMYEVHVAHRGSRGDGLNMAGLALISVGVIAWMAVQSLVITMSSALPFQPDVAQGGWAAEFSSSAWSSIYIIRMSLLLSGGVAVSAGLLLFALSVLIDSRGTVFNILTWLAALAGLVGTVAWAVAIFESSMLDSASSLGRGMYLFYVVWLITLGLRLAKEEERGEV